MVTNSVKKCVPIFEIFSPKAADLAQYCWIAQTFLITLLTTVFVFTAFDFEWLRKRVPGGRCGSPLKLAFNRLQLLIALVVYWVSLLFSPVVFVIYFLLWILKSFLDARENDINEVLKHLDTLNEVLKQIPGAHQIDIQEYYKIKKLVDNNAKNTQDMSIGSLVFLALFVFFLLAAKGAIERSKYAKAAAKSARDDDEEFEVIVAAGAGAKSANDRSVEIVPGTKSANGTVVDIVVGAENPVI
jgi:predicted PurR-regulated permease PerM